MESISGMPALNPRVPGGGGGGTFSLSAELNSSLVRLKQAKLSVVVTNLMKSIRRKLQKNGRKRLEILKF